MNKPIDHGWPMMNRATHPSVAGNKGGAGSLCPFISLGISAKSEAIPTQNMRLRATGPANSMGGPGSLRKRYG